MAAGIGFDGIEMYEPYVKDWHNQRMEGLASQIREIGLEISMWTSYADFASSDPSVRAEQTAHLQKAVDMAYLFGTHIVRVTAGAWIEGVAREDILENIASGLRGCLDYAESRAVLLALENHHVVGTRNQDFLQILELVNDARLKVNLDTSNPMVSGNNAVELVEQIADRVVHMHASDRRRDLHHCIEGTGEVDFAEIFSALQSAGYHGWISLEAAGQDADEIQQGLLYIRKTWEDTG
jgi:sugar phosphate isomerase/epimerase